MTKTNREKKTEAIIDFLAGMTIKDIAKKYGVKKTTVVGWYSKGKWKEKRDELQQEYERTIFSKYKKQIEDAVDKSLEISRAGSHICLIALKDILAACNEKKDKPREIIKELKEVADTAYKFAGIINRVMPNASEELSEKIHQELKEINDKIKGLQ